jgi:plastocyanin
MSRASIFFIASLFFVLPFGIALAHEASDTVTISITDKGFVPNYVTIDSGSRVVWKNDGENPHWPASGVHPTHSAYPEHSSSDCAGSSFDACRGLAPGESYSFMFDQVGKWSFHDHLNPNMTGVVEVVGDTASSSPSFFSKIGIALGSMFGSMTSWVGQLLSRHSLPTLAKGESIESYIREQMSLCNKAGGKGNCYSISQKY